MAPHKIHTLLGYVSDVILVTAFNSNDMRALVSYDDLTDSKSSRAKDPTISPPKKKQKSNRNAHKRSGQGGSNKTRYGIQEESRQLTHEDVWDDSALIAAWDAAAEEYEVCPGSLLSVYNSWDQLGFKWSGKELENRAGKKGPSVSSSVQSSAYV